MVVHAANAADLPAVGNVSGVALLVVLYIVVSKLRGTPVDHQCVRTLVRWLFGFLVIDLALEGLELLGMAYEKEESWAMISQLITGKLAVSYLGIQLALGSLVPLLTLGVLGFARIREELMVRVSLLAGTLVLVGVFAMRWNVVIGGQMLSKSLRGFGSYVPPLGGREGILAALVILSLPFIVLTVLTQFIPPWERVTRRQPLVSGRPATELRMESRTDIDERR